MTSSVTETKPPRLTASPKTRSTSSKTTILLPAATTQSERPAEILAHGVAAIRSRRTILPLKWSTTSKAILRSPAVRRESGNPSLMSAGTYSRRNRWLICSWGQSCARPCCTWDRRTGSAASLDTFGRRYLGLELLARCLVNIATTNEEWIGPDTMPALTP